MNQPDPTILVYCPYCQDAKPCTEEQADEDGKKIVRQTCDVSGAVTVSPF